MKLTGAALAAGAAIALISPVWACGFENPSAADLERGLLNWTFPNALYVTTAVWQAENSGILPPRTSKGGKGLTAYHRTATALEELALRISQNGGATADAPPLSIVLIETVLWTHLDHGPQGYTANVHRDGPAPGDVVIVTEGSVIEALVDARVTAKAAEDAGLLRYYGDVGKLKVIQEMLHRAHFVARSQAMHASEGGH